MKLPTIDLTRFSMSKLQAIVTHEAAEASVIITVVANVKNVDTGEIGPVASKCKLYYDESRNDERVMHRIHQAIRELLLHELDECLYINGERLCKEPHPEKRR